MVAVSKVVALALCGAQAQAHLNGDLAPRAKDCPQGQSLLDNKQCCNGPLVSVDNEDACCVMDGNCDMQCLKDPPCKAKIKLSDSDYQNKFDKANGKSSDSKGGDDSGKTKSSLGADVGLPSGLILASLGTGVFIGM